MSRYWLESRSNATLTVIDEVSDFEELTVRLRFNGLSTWTLTLRRESSYAATFLPDVNKALNNGILLWFDPEDGITAPILLLSGPEDTYQLGRKEDGTGVLLVNGYDDNFALHVRLAMPSPDYPYMGSFFDGVHTAPPYHYMFTTPTRYYKLNEASGATATDSSSNATNGTYSGTFGYGQPGMIDDPATCVKFDGAATEVQVPTGGLNAGNTAFSVLAWGMLSANPSGTVYMWSHGTNAAKQGVAMGVTSTGFPTIAVAGGGGSQTGPNAVILNQPFLLAMTWDGTTFTGYAYATGMPNGGGSIGSFAPGALTITYGFARIGDFLGASGFWPGWIGQVVFTNSTLAAATLQNIALVGISRQAYNGYDQRPVPPTVPNGGIGSTAIWQYVNANAGPGALPATTFQTGDGVIHPARPVPGLVMAADPLIGGNVYASARFDKLLILIQALALQAVPELGFKLQQVNQQLVFSIFQPTDRTATAVFSLDLGNLRSYTWQYGKAQANYLMTGGLNGGGTTLTDRTFGQIADQASIGRFGLIEDFYDYRKTTDGVTLQNVMQAKLLQLKDKRNINAAINDTNNLYFGGPGNKGYNLGDRVRVILEDGNIYDDLVREIDITLVKGQPAKVTAAIGTPIDAAVISELDTIAKRFKEHGVYINIVQNNY